MAPDYEADLHIDGKSLDLEWLNQAKVFMRYSREAADRRDELARAEERLDVTRAEADQRSRARHKDEKVTEAVIKAEVVTDAEYKTASEAVLALRHQVDILNAAVRAFDHRKAALESLVRLHGQQYFAGPVVPHDIGREFVRQTQETARGEARDRTAVRTGRRQS